MDTGVVQQLLERIASLLRAESRNALFTRGLQPVQFDALYYLSTCNRYSNTPTGVTEYLGQTKGTVSQSLKVLEKKGLIAKQIDSRDKRVAHLLLTAAGQRLINDLLPSPLLTSAHRCLGEKEFDAIQIELTRLLRGIQQANQFKTFGQCISCRHNLKEPDGSHTCGLTQEPLSQEDVTLICREHSP